jgi:hypothetical protein
VSDLRVEFDLSTSNILITASVLRLLAKRLSDISDEFDLSASNNLIPPSVPILFTAMVLSE